MSIIADVDRTIGWARLWDLILDFCPRCVNGLKNLVRVLTFPSHALSEFPICGKRNLPSSRYDLMSHVLDAHITFAVSGRELLPTLKTASDSNSVLFKDLFSLSNLY